MISVTTIIPNAHVATGRPKGGRSLLGAGNRFFLRSEVRRFAFASSSLPLRPSARWRRSSGSACLAVSSITSHRCCRSS